MGLRDDLIDLRRDLRRHPEIGLHLPRTRRKVLAALEGLPLEVTTGTALPSVTAMLRGGGRPGGERGPRAGAPDLAGRAAGAIDDLIGDAPCR
ncbi:hypothetical protein [Dactylosporangium sp. NPDC000521]|uniref:hypothetical protein n=1 Tax=Dactylosporangium sp. NPDC000521 TaxID=3363975 RepID=UPI0036AEC1A1